MRTEFLQRLYVILIAALPGLGIHADVAPPVDWYVLGCGALIVLGILVAGIVLVSVVVIRAIKKNAAPRDDA